jgi:hypothetical protein
MDQILPPELSSLNLRPCGKSRCIQPRATFRNRVQSRLKDIGYAKEVFGGLVPTDDGLRRVTIERERAPQAPVGDCRALPRLI